MRYISDEKPPTVKTGETTDSDSGKQNKWKNWKNLNINCLADFFFNH